MIRMFAIPNCDTVRKARNFLEKHKIDYAFIDFKKVPPSTAQIQAWAAYAGALPVNQKGLTYRKYKEVFEALSLPEKINFISAHTSLIKRPVLEQNGIPIALGFSEEQYGALLKKLVHEA